MGKTPDKPARRQGAGITRWLMRVAMLAAAIPMAAAGLLFIFSKQELIFNPAPLAYDLKSGSTLRSVARDLEALGIMTTPGSALLFEVMGRLRGDAPHIKAGNYEFESPATPLKLLQKMTRGDATQSAVRFIDGWTFRQIRQALDTHEALRHDTKDMSNQAIARALGVPEAQPEGWIFPETFHFSRGASDLAVLKRAHRLMQQHLATQWNSRAADLPLATPYEALILASIVEKETGKAADRAMVASVFVNRLRVNMRLQTDPSVIYGMGDDYSGTLRRRDLQADTPWNTYTRAGLPPTPIAMPGLASIQAALNPADSKMLYFVARGDGSSQFSRTLEEHNAAVNKYLRSGKR
jgi:UPF0755 protein